VPEADLEDELMKEVESLLEGRKSDPQS